MAAGTVGYTDTRGNKDYLGIIASQIKNRVTEASDMANKERQFAEEKAEEGGTSLDEAGIGKGHFFGKALGSKFGGDAIAKTRGRFAKTPSAGIDPSGSTASRFRGGFDYNVTNEILNRGGDGDASSQNEMLTNAVIAGFRGVENATIQVSQALVKIDETIGGLERTQMNMARAIMFQGYMMAMLQREQQRAAGRDSLRKEEKSIESGGPGGGRIGGQSFGGAGANRRMPNITSPKKGGDVLGAATSFGTSQLLGNKTLTQKGIQKGVQVAAKKSPKIAQVVGKVAPGLLPEASKVTKGAANTVKATKGALQASKAPKVLANATRILTGAKPTQKLLQNANKLARSPGKLAKNIATQAKKVKSLRSLTGSMGGANKLLQQMNTMPDPFKVANNLDDFGDFAHRMASKSSTDMVQEAFFNKKAYGAAMNTPDEMAEMYAKLVGGQIDGVKYSDKVARNITKEILGPDKYKIFTKNADKPVKSAATFTHKMLRAPAIKSAQKSVAKTAGKTAAKAGAKSIMKKIPIIAGLAGVAFGIQRAMEGDLMGAGLEIASGIMGATGVGGGLGLAIDGYLLGRDLGMMNKGGLVPGRGENKDTVPTLLTPGEFIMNRNAVDNIGADTLSFMNSNDSGGDFGYSSILGGTGSDLDLTGISSNVQEIAPAINQLSQQIVSIAGGGGTNVVNNVVNNYGSGEKPGGGGGDSDGGDFSSSGLDAFRLQYLGSLS